MSNLGVKNGGAENGGFFIMYDGFENCECRAPQLFNQDGFPWSYRLIARTRTLRSYRDDLNNLDELNK